MLFRGQRWWMRWEGVGRLKTIRFTIKGNDRSISFMKGWTNYIIPKGLVGALGPTERGFKINEQQRKTVIVCNPPLNSSF